MKQNILVFLLVLSSIIVVGAVGLKRVKGDSQDELKLILEASKETYKLGEKLDFSFALSNIGEKDFQLWDVFSTGPGHLNLQCSTNGKDFSGCSDPSWGTSDFIVCEPTRIKPGETISTSTSILWNWKSQDIPTYRFLKSGTYYVKAVYIVSFQGKDGRIEKYELRSEPIKIDIEEPPGEDLEVWNKIKDDGNFAYLTQWNEIRIPSYKTQERAKFIQKVKEIINAHPHSFYARSLHANLEKFNVAEEKRKTMIEKLNSKPPQ